MFLSSLGLDPFPESKIVSPLILEKVLFISLQVLSFPILFIIFCWNSSLSFMSLNFYIFHLFVLFTLRMWIISSDLSSISPILPLVALNLLNSPRNVFWKRFIYSYFGCAGSLLLRLGFLRSWWAGLFHRGGWASHCGGLSCCGAQAPGAEASCAATCGLQSTGSAAAVQAYLLHDTWGLPVPGVKLVSLVLQGQVLTTAPARKPLHF